MQLGSQVGDWEAMEINGIGREVVMEAGRCGGQPRGKIPSILRQLNFLSWPELLLIGFGERWQGKIPLVSSALQHTDKCFKKKLIIDEMDVNTLLFTYCLLILKHPITM